MEAIMYKLEKIKDISARYKVTTNTLRYYEKMGLIESSRCESSGYRLYDEAALVRLRQILILRKMNISIGDIKKIFEANNSDVVLSVLDKKTDDIDSEVALLYELKEIVLAFIQQLRQADFRNDTDVKMLFDKAMKIETSLTKEKANMERLLDTSDELDENLTSIAIESETDNTPATLIKWEVVKNEPLRFIGKSVYVRIAVSNEFIDTARKLDWVFEKINDLC